MSAKHIFSTALIALITIMIAKQIPVIQSYV
jgi:hypothetical protein